MSVQRTDLLVGMFIIGSAAAVLGALVATSGWGVDRYDVYVRTVDAADVAVDTKIYLRGFEVGRVAEIEPRPAAGGRGVEFVIRASLLAKFPDGSPLHLPLGTAAEVVTGLLGGSTLQLATPDSARGHLEPGDTIEMRRRAAAMEALGNLATDMKGIIQEALVATTQTLRSVRQLADSLSNATGQARRFVAGIQPGTEEVLNETALGLQRLQLALDSANVRSGVTLGQLNQTMTQSRRLMASADSLTRLMTATGADARPEVRQLLVNFRQLSEQLQYVMEQLGRRPMRMVTGVTIPESLTVEGRARRAASDSARGANRGGTRPDSLP